MEQVIVNGLYLGAQYALIALGLTLIFALMNVLNFAHGQMYVLGGFVTYTMYGRIGVPFVAALFVTGVTLAAIGALIEKFLFRPVIKRTEREEGTMMLAAAVAFFFDAIILLLFGEKQRGVPKIVSGVFVSDSLIMPYDPCLSARPPSFSSPRSCCSCSAASPVGRCGRWCRKADMCSLTCQSRTTF
jgi:branched-chain amino acid transport system permease protein